MVSITSYMRGRGKFESEDQEKGMKSLFQYLQGSGRLTDMNSIWHAIGWLIQKDSESAKWFSGVIGDHVSRLEDQIMASNKLIAQSDATINLLVQSVDDLQKEVSQLRKNRESKHTVTKSEGENSR